MSLDIPDQTNAVKPEDALAFRVLTLVRGMQHLEAAAYLELTKLEEKFWKEEGVDEMPEQETEILKNLRKNYGFNIRGIATSGYVRKTEY